MAPWTRFSLSTVDVVRCSPIGGLTSSPWLSGQAPGRVGLSPYYLGDTSALARAQRPEVAARLDPLLEAGLLIAAAAEAAGLVVLHYDHDFDLIAEITGQPMEWIVPAGAVP